MNFQALLNIIKQSALDAGQFIKDELHKVKLEDIEEKELNSLVSYVDKEAEKKIVSALQSQNHVIASFITEEDTLANQSDVHDYKFVIDPLDGTTNYLKKIPHFAVSIGLEFKGDPVLAVVYDIMQNDMYYAQKNHGAFLNENQIHCSKIDSLDKAIVATGFPYANVDYEKKFSVLKIWLEQSRGIRRMGSAALDLVYVASGKLDVYYEAHLNRWDLSAGALIATEAGATVTDFKAKQEHLDLGQIVACAPGIHEKVINIIDGYI